MKVPERTGTFASPFLVIHARPRPVGESKCTRQGTGPFQFASQDPIVACFCTLLIHVNSNFCDHRCMNTTHYCIIRHSPITCGTNQPKSRPRRQERGQQHERVFEPSLRHEHHGRGSTSFWFAPYFILEVFSKWTTQRNERKSQRANEETVRSGLVSTLQIFTVCPLSRLLSIFLAKV